MCSRVFARVCCSNSQLLAVTCIERIEHGMVSTHASVCRWGSSGPHHTRRLLQWPDWSYQVSHSGSALYCRQWRPQIHSGQGESATPPPPTSSLSLLFFFPSSSSFILSLLLLSFFLSSSSFILSLLPCMFACRSHSHVLYARHWILKFAMSTICVNVNLV